MDTTTVLEIIKMIETSINHHHDHIEKNEPDRQGRIGAHMALSELRDHLQSFIEGQLNAEENKTGE